MSIDLELLQERLEKIEAKQKEQDVEHLRIKQEIQRIDGMTLSELDFKVMHDFVFKMARLYEQYNASNDAPRCSLIFPEGTSGALNKAHVPQVDRWNFCIDYSMAVQAMGKVEEQGATPYHSQKMKLFIGVMHGGKGIRKLGCEEMGLRRDYAQKLWHEAIEYMYLYLEEYDWRRMEQKEDEARLQRARQEAAKYFGNEVVATAKNKEVA